MSARNDRGIPRRAFMLGLAGAAAFRLPRIDWQNARADLILHDGDVRIGDRGFRKARAIAISGGKVLATGATSEIRRLAGSATQSIDLRGRTLLAGANDSHLHAVSWGFSLPPFNVDVAFPTVKSIAEAVEQIRKAVDSRQPGDWIQGRGWDQPYFAEGRAPTRQDLDRVSPNNPVILTEFSGHAIWVNSKALELAGITRDTVPPTGGVIVKDSAGDPTGVLFEGAAGLVRRLVPPFSPADRRKAFDVAAALMASNGITSFTEPGLPPEVIAFYAELAAAGGLKARLTALLGAGRNVALVQRALDGYKPATGLEPRWMRVAGMKLFADGIPTNNKTAWLHQPYQDGGNGVLVIGEGKDEERVAELEKVVQMIHEAGWQIGTHVTGDRAIDAVVTAYEKALARRPDADRRHYLIHSDLVTPQALIRMGKVGIGANFNSTIKYMIADGQVASIGPTRASYEWPYHTALAAGVKVATGSDAPVTDGNWRQGLATCVARIGKQSGKVSGPDQRISLDQAIWSHTAAGAWQDHAEAWKGTLEKGMVADLCVLDGPIDKVDPAALGEMKVDLTVVDGKVIFER